MPRNIFKLVVPITLHLLANYGEPARAADQLMLGAGPPGSASHQLGVGLSSLVKIVVLPDRGIDLELTNQHSTLDGEHMLLGRQSTLQALRPAHLTGAFRSVMVFRSQDPTAEVVLELISRADVPTNFIYGITKAIFENGPFLNKVSDTTWSFSIDQALRGLQLPIHQGALRYYDESGSFNQQIGENPHVAEFHGESTFYAYFEGQHTHLDRATQDQIAAACRYAAIYQAPLMRVSEPTNDVVEIGASERLQQVVEALNQDKNCGPETSILILNEAKATLPTELLEANIDRIEITIYLSKSDRS